MADKKFSGKSQADSIEDNQKYRVNVLDSGCSSSRLQSSSSSIFESSQSPKLEEEELTEGCSSQSGCSEDISEGCSSQSGCSENTSKG